MTTSPWKHSSSPILINSRREFFFTEIHFSKVLHRYNSISQPDLVLLLDLRFCQMPSYFCNLYHNFHVQDPLGCLPHKGSLHPLVPRLFQHWMHPIMRWAHQNLYVAILYQFYQLSLKSSHYHAVNRINLWVKSQGFPNIFRIFLHLTIVNNWSLRDKIDVLNLHFVEWVEAFLKYILYPNDFDD